MTEKYTKDQIEKLIWEKPIMKVAESMGVTDCALHKRCEKLGVVKPPQGHWAKVYNGKPVTTIDQERKRQNTAKKKKAIAKPTKPKGWRIELYFGVFKTGLQITKN